MKKIQPSTILRNYNRVIDEVHEDGESIILTKNGIGKVVMVDIDEWNRNEAEIRLLTELNQAERTFGEGKELKDFAKEYLIGELDE